MRLWGWIAPSSFEYFEMTKLKNGGKIGTKKPEKANSKETGTI